MAQCRARPTVAPATPGWTLWRFSTPERAPFPVIHTALYPAGPQRSGLLSTIASNRACHTLPNVPCV